MKGKIVALTLCLCLLVAGCTTQVQEPQPEPASGTDNELPPFSGEMVILKEPSVNYEVVFPDPNLELAIRDATGKLDGTLYATDVAPITKLHAPLKGIRDLTGIEQCINLGEIVLSSNEITDLSPLADLTGRLIRAYDDGKLVREYTELRIFLPNNNITKIPDLSKLASVTEVIIDLSYNKIEDISPLAELPNIVALWLFCNRISDISPLKGLPHIGGLNLWNNSISDISPLKGLTELAILNLEDNEVEDVSPLADLTNLDLLILRHNKITDVSPLAGLTRLSYLDLSYNQITDASPLEALKNTEILLEGNPLR